MTERSSDHNDLGWPFCDDTDPRTCSVELCQRPAETKGMCRAHHMRWQRGSDLSRPIGGPRGAGTPRPDAAPQFPVRPLSDFDLSWQADANCKGLSADLFFPDEYDPVTGAEAKKVCAGCQVRAACLEYALALPERHGIFGGMSPKERTRLRVARRKGAA